MSRISVYSDSEGEDEEYNLVNFNIYQALPVPDGEPDWSEEFPQSVEEYLKRVRYEARTIPKVVRKEITSLKIDAKPQLNGASLSKAAKTDSLFESGGVTSSSEGLTAVAIPRASMTLSSEEGCSRSEALDGTREVGNQSVGGGQTDFSSLGSSSSPDQAKLRNIDKPGSHDANSAIQKPRANASSSAAVSRSLGAFVLRVHTRSWSHAPQVDGGCHSESAESACLGDDEGTDGQGVACMSGTRDGRAGHACPKGVPPSSFTRRGTAAEDAPSPSAAPEALSRPGRAWCLKLLYDFHVLRGNLQKLRARFEGALSSGTRRAPPLPSYLNSKRWMEFCFPHQKKSAVLQDDPAAVSSETRSLEDSRPSFKSGHDLDTSLPSQLQEQAENVFEVYTLRSLFLAQVNFASVLSSDSDPKEGNEAEAGDAVLGTVLRLDPFTLQTVLELVVENIQTAADLCSVTVCWTCLLAGTIEGPPLLPDTSAALSAGLRKFQKMRSTLEASLSRARGSGSKASSSAASEPLPRRAATDAPDRGDEAFRRLVILNAFILICGAYYKQDPDLIGLRDEALKAGEAGQLSGTAQAAPHLCQQQPPSQLTSPPTSLPAVRDAPQCPASHGLPPSQQRDSVPPPDPHSAADRARLFAQFPAGVSLGRGVPSPPSPGRMAPPYPYPSGAHYYGGFSPYTYGGFGGPEDITGKGTVSSSVRPPPMMAYHQAPPPMMACHQAPPFASRAHYSYWPAPAPYVSPDWAGSVPVAAGARDPLLHQAPFGPRHPETTRWSNDPIFPPAHAPASAPEDRRGPQAHRRGKVDSNRQPSQPSGLACGLPDQVAGSRSKDGPSSRSSGSRPAAQDKSQEACWTAAASTCERCRRNGCPEMDRRLAYDSYCCPTCPCYGDWYGTAAQGGCVLCAQSVAYGGTPHCWPEGLCPQYGVNPWWSSSVPYHCPPWSFQGS